MIIRNETQQFNNKNLENVIVLFDMDGTLNYFEKGVPVEDTKKPGFMASRKPIEQMILFLSVLKLQGVQTGILSAVYQNNFSQKEKERWLDSQNLQGIERYFVPCGTSKGAVFTALKDKYPEKKVVLIDDYSPNLFDWEEAGGISLKFYNDINGNFGTWENHYQGRNAIKITDSISAMQHSLMFACF